MLFRSYLTKGTKIEVVGIASNGWYKIKYQDGYGFVSGKNVKLEDCTGKTTSGLNVRSSATTKEDNKIGYLNKGSELQIVQICSNGWYKIVFEDGYGYISGKYVQLD